MILGYTRRPSQHSPLEVTMFFSASSLFQLFQKNYLSLVVFLPYVSKGFKGSTSGPAYCFELWPLVSNRITPTFMSMIVDSSMFVLFDSLCPSQQFIQSCRDWSSWVDQTMQRIKCLAQGQNTVTLLAMMLTPETLLSPLKRSTN